MGILIEIVYLESSLLIWDFIIVYKFDIVILFGGIFIKEIIKVI